VHEIQPGVVYKDENVTVTAIAVKHGPCDESCGYRFRTPDRTFVISGDTSPADSACTRATGATCCWTRSIRGPQHPMSDGWKPYFATFHTSTAQLGGLAKPKLLVLYHQLFPGVSEGEMLREVCEHYSGAVASVPTIEMSTESIAGLSAVCPSARSVHLPKFRCFPFRCEPPASTKQ